MFRAQFDELSCLQSVGAAAAAAVVQVADTNNGTYIQTYRSTMSLLVTEFTYLDGRDGELMVKELADAESHSNRVSSYTFKIPYVGKKYLSLTLE